MNEMDGQIAAWFVQLSVSVFGLAYGIFAIVIEHVVEGKNRNNNINDQPYVPIV
jgi:hypothetical protein